MSSRERLEEQQGTTTLVEPATPPHPLAAPAVAQTAIATLSRSDSSRSRTTAGLGALLAAFAAVFSLVIPGDRTGRVIMMGGLGMVALTNGWVFFVVRDPTKLRKWLIAIPGTRVRRSWSSSSAMRKFGLTTTARLGARTEESRSCIGNWEPVWKWFQKEIPFGRS